MFSDTGIPLFAQPGSSCTCPELRQSVVGRNRNENSFFLEPLLVLGENIYKRIVRRENRIDLFKPANLQNPPDVRFFSFRIFFLDNAACPVRIGARYIVTTVNEP